MGKHVIDLRPECKLIQQVCQSDGHLGVSTVSVGLLDELNDNYVQEHFSTILRDEYDRGYKDGCDVTETQANDDANKQGLEDAWEYAKKIVLNPDDGGLGLSELNEIFGFYTLQSIFKNYTVQQAIEKLKAYEKEQKADVPIKVGDEVMVYGNRGVVTYICNDDYTIMMYDGSCGDWKKTELKKTGKQHDIEGLLKVMNGVTE